MKHSRELAFTATGIMKLDPTSNRANELERLMLLGI
jgi:hypothetical protein